MLWGLKDKASNWLLRASIMEWACDGSYESVQYCILNCMLYCLMNDLSQELANVFLKGQIVKILDSAGPIVCLCNFATVAQKWPTENT